jgi:hypothetical protein
MRSSRLSSDHYFADGRRSRQRFVSNGRRTGLPNQYWAPSRNGGRLRVDRTGRLFASEATPLLRVSGFGEASTHNRARIDEEGACGIPSSP